MAGISGLACPDKLIDVPHGVAFLTEKYVSGINAFRHFPTDNLGYRVIFRSTHLMLPDASTILVRVEPHANL